MSFNAHFLTNMEVYLASLLLMLGVFVMSIRTTRREDTKSMIYITMVILIIIQAAAGMIQGFTGEFHGPKILMILMDLVLELALDLQILFILLYVMYEIFENKDYIMRRIKIYAIPLYILVAATFVNLFTGWIWYYDEDLNYHENDIYYVYVLLRYFYVLVAVILYLRYHKQKKNTNRFRIWFFALPMVIGCLVEIFSGYLVFMLGVAISYAVLYMIHATDKSYIDQETGLYSPYFLTQLYGFVEGGAYRLSSVLTFDISDEHDARAFSDIIRMVLPDECDTIRTRPGRFITVSESSDAGYLFMTIEDVEMLTKEAGIKVKIDTAVRRIKEPPEDFFIDKIGYAR